MFKPIVYKGLVFFKLGSVVAKLSVFCSAITTVATILNDIEFELGGVIDVVCIVTYILAIGISSYGYDRTAHVPPVSSRKNYGFSAQKSQF